MLKGVAEGEFDVDDRGFAAEEPKFVDPGCEGLKKGFELVEFVFAGAPKGFEATGVGAA